jgi:DnaJ homolog subfamily A member 2
MEDSRGFYKALGLQSGASVDEVKKAYKKKQFELHPAGPVRKKLKDSPEYKALTDDQKAEREAKLDEEVAKVNEAYTVLSDEKKKNEYDTGTGQFSQFAGMDGFEGFSGFPGFDIFSSFGGRKKQKEQAKSVVSDIRVEYRDLFLGKSSKFRVNSQKVCRTCKGSGSKVTSTCGKCKGAGQVMAKVSLGIMTTAMPVECPDCKGSGNVGKGPACSDCSGKKVYQDSRIIEVTIPAGQQAGVPIVFKGQGNEAPGLAPGDLIFNVVLNEVAGCNRIGNDFVCRVDVDILTALAGGVIYFEHPDGRKLGIKVQPFKDFEAAIVVPNAGFPSKSKRGDLYLKPKILVNSGIDRNKLSEYLKPLISKPQGDFAPTNSHFGQAPVLQEESYDERGGFEGFSASDFFRFF